MRTYTIKGKDHYVYDLESEVPSGTNIVKNWRDGYPGDWVLTDDNAYVQILERKKVGKLTVLRTCIGTYKIDGVLDTAERESRYTLNGKLDATTIKERKKPTNREVEFATKIVRGSDAVKAYMDTFDAKSKPYAKRRAALLLKTERIINLMNPTEEELTKVFEKLDVNLEMLIATAKNEAVDGKNGSDRLNALKMLWDVYGVVTKKKITEVAGIFQGFEAAQIEDVKRPALQEVNSKK